MTSGTDAVKRFRIGSAEPRFGALVFDYLKTVVPFWRLCDEAWALGEDHLVGIGVLRNYGGQLMVVLQSDGWSKPHPAWPNIEPALEAAGYSRDRIVVVVDDRSGVPEVRQTMQFPQVLWSERERLKDYLVKDEP
jgi:hypothetical protein